MSTTQSDRPTTKMTSEELLGLVHSTHAKTSTEDLAPEIEIVAALETPIPVGTRKSERSASHPPTMSRWSQRHR